MGKDFSDNLKYSSKLSAEQVYESIRKEATESRAVLVNNSLNHLRIRGYESDSLAISSAMGSLTTRSEASAVQPEENTGDVIQIDAVRRAVDESLKETA